VERAGCFVVHTDLGNSAVDGVTIAAPSAPPCIFLNKNQTADRMRYTLAHELGHLVMHRVPNVRMEHQANTFASSLLMPPTDIESYFSARRLDLKRLAELKPEWKVSMQALLYWAEQLGYVTENQARYLWQQFNAKKIRFREPPELDLEPERPSVMPKLINLHLGQLGYSVGELSKLMRMHEQEFIEFHDIQISATPAPKRPVLRVVS
jgi:Zn-dependent peptidase ImmA (M78 family)